MSKYEIDDLGGKLEDTEIIDDLKLPELAIEDRYAARIRAEEKRQKEFKELCEGRTLTALPVNLFAKAIQPKSDRRPVISSRERYRHSNGSRKRRVRIHHTRTREVQQARSQREKGVPHFLEKVMGYLLLNCGDIPNKGYEAIAAILGIHPDTVENCVHWLERKGWLDYYHTRGVTGRGHKVRQANTYVFHDPAEDSIFKRTLRAIRPIWRDRPNRNGSGGDKETSFIIEADPSAKERLKQIREARSQELDKIWFSSLRLTI